MPETVSTTAEAVTAPTPELKPTEAAPPEKKEIYDPLEVAKRFSKLAKQEEGQRREREEWQRTKTELEEKARKADEYEQLFSTAKDAPEKVAALLDKAGLSFDEVAQLMLSNAQTPKEVLEIKSELKTLRSQLEEKEEKDKQERVNSTRSYIDSQIEIYKEDVKEHVQKNPDRFELIIANEAIEDVFSVVEKFFEETGEIVSPEEAATFVEQTLEEEAEKFLKAKKFSSRLAPKVEPTQETAKQDARESRRPSPTIGNRASVSPSVPVKTPEANTEEERMARAMAVLKNRKRIED
jgi:hypothetical protein